MYGASDGDGSTLPALSTLSLPWVSNEFPKKSQVPTSLQYRQQQYFTRCLSAFLHYRATLLCTTLHGALTCACVRMQSQRAWGARACAMQMCLAAGCHMALVACAGPGSLNPLGKGTRRCQPDATAIKPHMPPSLSRAHGTSPHAQCMHS